MPPGALPAAAAMALLAARAPAPPAGAGLGCAAGACGACCASILTAWPVSGRAEEAARPDPALPGSWEGGVLPGPEVVAGARREWLTSCFVVGHWSPDVSGTTATRAALGREDVYRWRCSAFDPDSRLCTAHAERPPVCEQAVFYDSAPHAAPLRDPTAADGLLGVATVGGGRAHCSYGWDVPPDRRPNGSRPLIPLEVLHG